MAIPPTLLQTTISPRKKSEEELEKIREAQAAKTRAEETAKEFNRNRIKVDPTASLIGKDYEQEKEDYAAVKDFGDADFSEKPSEITGFSPNTGDNADAESVARGSEIAQRFATAEEATRAVGLAPKGVSDQVASTAQEVAQQPIDTKQLIADTKALVEKARSLGQPSEEANKTPESDTYGIRSVVDFANDAGLAAAKSFRGSQEEKIRNTGGSPARPENIESAGQVFKNFYDLNQRTEGRKDFAASLDAAGYDPSTASAEDKAKFYAQGKELGLSSEQIDKYRNDKITAAADLKYRRENPREFIMREANQFGARGGLGGARGLGGGSRPISGMGDSNIRMSKADQDKQERRRRYFG